MKHAFALVLAATALLLGGCSSGSSNPAEVKHTSHLWQTDREATLELIRNRFPEEGADIDASQTGDVIGVYDVMLELFSDGTYVLHVRSGGELFESEGSWKHTPVGSGARVRLDPYASRTHNQELMAYIRSWSIRIEDSGDRARIRSLSEVDTVLTRLD